MAYRKNHIQKNLLNFLEVSLILGFLSLYVFQFNDLVKKSYLINNYKNNLNNLSEENEILKLEFLQNGSLKDLENIAAKMDFEKVKEIKYIQISSDSFAKR